MPTKVRLPSLKHQQYIRQADLVLKRLREVSTVVQLPEALGILRKMNPYAFEELLLTCCHERGWKIERNFKYSNDGQYCSVKVCNCQCSGQNHENSSLSASDKSQFLVIRTVLQ